MKTNEIWSIYQETIEEIDFKIFARSQPIHSVKQAKIALEQIHQNIKQPDGSITTIHNSPTLSTIREHELQHITEVIDKKGKHYFGGRLYLGFNSNGIVAVAYQLPSNIPPEASCRSYLAPGRSGRNNLSKQDINEAFCSYLMKRQSFNGGCPKHRR